MNRGSSNVSEPAGGPPESLEDAYASLIDKARYLQIIHELALAMLQQSSLDELLWFITERAISQLGFEDCVIYILDHNRDVLVQRAAYGPKSPTGHLIVNPIEIPVDSGIVGVVARTGKRERVDDVNKDERYIADDKRRRSELAVPILSDGRVIGIIDSEHSTPGFYTDEHAEMLTTIASMASTKIASALLVEKHTEELESQVAARTHELQAANERLKQAAAELEQWNRTLEDRVLEQVAHIERLGQLRRFLSPAVAEMIISSGDTQFLKTHRSEIATVFCDLRGFTAFSEVAEPEEVMKLLTAYHEVVGEIVFRFQGTIEHRAGDGMMVVFNDPLPCENPALRAVEMAVSMRAETEQLLDDWRRHGYELGFGVGISFGYGTIGLMGYEGRFDYSATGRSVNLASRLCDHAKDRQILINQLLLAELEEFVDAEFVDDLEIKGFQRPVKAFNVRNLKSAST